MAYIEEILGKLGWNDGFQIPVANVENQALERELAALTLQKVKSKNSLDVAVTRLNNLKSHFKFLNQENEQTQKLITAHKQQYDSEENQFHSLKGENNKVEHDVQEVHKKMQFLEERMANQKKTLENAVIKVDRIKQETGWDIEALKAWEETLKKRDEDNELIRKFSKEDERKFNELEAKRQFLQGEYDQKNFTVKKKMCDLHGCEMIIERTGKAIKQQMDERDALIKQWKDSVKMLQQRDQDIETTQNRILEAERMLANHQEQLEEENAMLGNEKKNNHEIDMEIEKLTALNTRMRRDLADLQQNIYAVANECSTVKRLVTASANNLEKLRIQSRKIEVETDKKERKCIKYEKDMENLQSKIIDMKGNNFSAAERIKKIKKMIETEEKRCNILMSDTDKINGQLYRTNQLLKEQQSVGKTLEIQINQTHCICNKLRKHIVDEKKALEKVKEVVYNMQFRIDEFEQRLCKLEGSNKSEEPTDENEEKIRNLEKTLAEHVEVQHTLQTQVERLQDEMRKLSNFIAADREELEILKNKVENYSLVYDIGLKQIATAKRSTQEQQVEENIMRLRINRIETNMKKEEKKIFNLQKLRLALDQAMKEHTLEIDTKKVIVLAKKRNLEEEKGRLKSDISLRKVKIEQMQKKYHIELMTLGKDEEGQPLSVTHFKIKFAQEKFTLQQQGDELDNKIKVAEKEIVAIENTLKIVNLTNVAFKNNLSPLKDDDIELKEMNILEKIHKEKLQEIRKVRQKLAEQQAVNDEIVKQLNEHLKPQRIEKHNVIKHLEEDNIFIGEQERNKEEKLRRTEAQLRKYLRKLQSRDLSVYEQDLEVRQLRDANNTVMKRIHFMMNNNIDTAPNIRKYIEEHNISLKTEYSLSSNTISTISGSLSSDTSSTNTEVTNFKSVTVNKVDLSFS
ncbi:hypothetical protein ABEB36_011935 [Hypothenemus hampei]|uniref:Coiled-coil domain-containing protein 39 n=1 Tax=Hypothenemus hampei TaxID=57062 RepID=A0ABD1E9J1_HYPHA